ncbi:hypothetical protein ABEB36_013397 [Hypothenemus hampei]|uniref:MICAL-like protein 2 n=1 Tax=Hypothenemus hampei TaxID=57062 RepID=A0ABD1ECA5_HYPHA
MSERRGTKGLELWCKKMTEGYTGVKIENMTTSWRDGLAFCALIHRFRPDLIDFNKLNKDDIYHNNELAFRVAEHHLGIPSLLDAEDMVEHEVPDRLSILTYLSQFYQTFENQRGQSGARTTPKRPPASPDHGIVSPASTSPPTKMKINIGTPRREPCAKCGLPVFIAERLNVEKHLYHRTCFRCARCKSQLTLANYYETENGEFCCEICPDEETVQPQSKKSHIQDSVLSRALSDEEKSASLQIAASSYPYSNRFEATLDEKDTKNHSYSISFNEDRNSRYTQARSKFFNSQLDDLDSVNSDNKQTVVNSNESRTLDCQFVTKNDDVSSFKEVNVKEKLKLFENASQETDVHTYSISIKPKIDKELEEINSSNSSIMHSQSENIVEDLETTTEEINVKEAMPEKSIASQKVEYELHEKATESYVASHDPPESVELDYIDAIVDGVDTIPTASHEEDDLSANISDTEETNVVEENIEIDKEPSIAMSQEEEKTLEPNLNEQSKENEEADTNIIYPNVLNPFDEEEDGEDLPIQTQPVPVARSKKKILSIVKNDSPKPQPRKKLIPTSMEKNIQDTPVFKMNINPFEDEENDQENKELNACYNPFEDDEDEVLEKRIKPSSVNNSPWSKASQSKDSLSVASFGSPYGGSTSSLSSESLMGSVRKKKPAPKPPEPFSSTSPPSSLVQSPYSSGTIRSRKSKRAPMPPPLLSSTPFSDNTKMLDSNVEDFSPVTSEVQEEKRVKNEENKHRQNLDAPSNLSRSDKSASGRWKRRKGQAPSRPVPHRRHVKSLPISEIKRELDTIEIQQQGLEKQGVKLEQLIREKCEHENADEQVPTEAEDLIMQLFELVNEKNELFRRQAELMYLRRQQRLEEEYADVEYQIRCLMVKSEANKSDSDKVWEEILISRLVEIVERRNEIIECLEMDRKRETEEDNSINNQLKLYSTKKEEAQETAVKAENKKLKHKKLNKIMTTFKHKKEKRHKIDLDKDVNECEATPISEKEKKKKFHLF